MEKQIESELFSLSIFQRILKQLIKKEMWRLRDNGDQVSQLGKTFTYPIEHVSSLEMKTHLCLLEKLFGVQKRCISGCGLPFLQNPTCLNTSKQKTYSLQSCTVSNGISSNKKSCSQSYTVAPYILQQSLFP